MEYFSLGWLEESLKILKLLLKLFNYVLFLFKTYAVTPV